MTKAECFVDGPSWKRTPSLDNTKYKHDGTPYTTRFYVHDSGATLECDNYYGDSWLTIARAPWSRRNIEAIYDINPTFLQLTQDSSLRR